MNRLGKANTSRVSKYPTNTDYLTLAYSAFEKQGQVDVIATTDHIEKYFALLGINSAFFAVWKRFGPHYPARQEIHLMLHTFDLYTWLLDIPTIDVCGQVLQMSPTHLNIPISVFENVGKAQGSHGLTEAKLRSNYECVCDYRPVGSKKGDPVDLVTKVFIWGDKYENKPMLWNGLGNGRAVVQACCGDSHMAFLTGVGEVITSGESSYGQIGNGPSFATVDSFRVRMPGDVFVTQIACGNYYTLALSESHNVYYWGTCRYSVPHGEYNIPKQVVLFKTSVPTMWTDIQRDRITQIASGAAHILMLRSDGVALSVGAPDSGRLGRAGSALKPLPISTDFVISKIGCGYASSMAFANGRVYVWGRDTGLDAAMLNADPNAPHYIDPSNVAQSTELILPDLAPTTRVHDVVYGYKLNFAITSEGAYTWGANGPSTPMKLDTSINFSQFAVGTRHILARTATGEVYSWGTSHLGQCGHGDQFVYPRPTRIRGLPPNVSGVAACRDISLAFTGLLRAALSLDFRKCVNNPKSFPDIAFQVGSSLFYAHRAMIVARCHELKIMHLLLGNGAAPLPEPKTVRLGQTVVERYEWPDGCFPNSPPSSNGSFMSPTAASSDSEPNSEVMIIPFDKTTSGMSVTSDAMMGLLKYIYCDYISESALKDLETTRSLAIDFGLPRLAGLLNNDAKSQSLPSTYTHDIDALIQSPDDELPVSGDELSTSALQLKKQMKTIVGAFSDLAITLSDSNTVIPAHRFVLCARSNYFSTILSGSMVEATTRTVNLQTDELTCRWLMRFIYSDRPCNSDINITVELMKLGAMINLDRLVYLCSREIEKELDLETTCYMYHLTSEHSISALQEICWSIIFRDFESVKQTNYWKENLLQEERDIWLKRFNENTPTVK